LTATTAGRISEQAFHFELPLLVVRDLTAHLIFVLVRFAAAFLVFKVSAHGPAPAFANTSAGGDLAGRQ
jgi:hypothetical protein